MHTILFFDGHCSLCSKEIRLLKKLKRDSLVLVDIHSNSFESFAEGIAASTMLEVLHLRDSNGTWLTGLDATVAAWSHTAVGWIFKPLRWPGIKVFADLLYLRWAQKRACRLGYSPK